MKCLNCKKITPFDNKYCGDCGTKLQTDSQPDLTSVNHPVTNNSAADLKRFKSRSNWWSGIFIITCFTLSYLSTNDLVLGLAILLISLVSYTLAFINYAKYKGYDSTFGWWALAGPIGVLVIYFAKNKNS